MGRKPQVQARIPVDVKASLDEYCEENNLSTSDGVRRALEKEYGEMSVARQTLVFRTVGVMLSAALGAAAGGAL